MRAGILAAMTALWLLPAGAQAAVGPGGQAPASWNEMQKFEYYLGRMSGALSLCRHFALAAQLKELADLTPYGRKGFTSMQGFDGMAGAQCGRIASDAEELLGDRDKLWAYLTEKYDCQGVECTLEGDGSTSAICRAEVDEHLKTLPIDTGDIQSIRMVNGNAGSSQIRAGKKGHEAWVRLGSCEGWLIIETTIGCTPRQSFTRGDCDIEGIKGY